MQRVIALSVCAALALGYGQLSAGGKKKEGDSKEALQALQDFIGGWKGSVSKGGSIWKESAEWSWRFKGKDVFFSVDMKDSKIYKSGELRYMPEKSKYQLVLVDKKDNKQVFEGDLKKTYLTLERLDPETKDTQQIKVNTAAGGIRLIWTYSIKPEERTLFNQQFQLSYTKDGESFGVVAGGKKPECVVTFGLGTMPVSFMGVTYYVCCSGCRDAFNDNPAKIIKEYLARKKKGE